MKTFLSNLAKFSLVGLVPLLIILGTYFYYDPFKILYEYDDYSNSPVSLNRDYVSTQMFIKNYPIYHYNSFILGSSRTIAYRPEEWIKHLPYNASPFVFDAYSESAYGIYVKLRYLDAINCKIDNALIILCRDQTFAQTENQRGHLFMKDPATSHESNLSFQKESFKSYLNPYFLYSFYYFEVTKKYKDFMWGNVEERPISYDKKTNAILEIFNKEKDILSDPNGYYLKRIEEFYRRSGEKIDSMQRINAPILYQFKEIARILKKHKTNYKVVLSPLYEQIRYSKQDMQILNNLFADRLYDFSGKNAFTDDKHNFYESSHYRKIVADSIMRVIYR